MELASELIRIFNQYILDECFITGLISGAIVATCTFYARKFIDFDAKHDRIGTKTTSNDEIAVNLKRWDEGLIHTKMAFFIRTDLKMKPGKIVAQCSHAVLGACAKEIDSEHMDQWHEDSQPKVFHCVNSEEQLMELKNRAKEMGLKPYIVCDAGRTQVPSNSYTVLAVGPAHPDDIDLLIGQLKKL